MAEPARDFTANDEPITAREMRNRFDHMDNLIHEILSVIQELATPEARALLKKFSDNPAMRWQARRNGSKT